MKKMAFIAAVLLLTATACTKEPVANFDVKVGAQYDNNEHMVYAHDGRDYDGLHVAIINKTKHAVSYAWEWGDGGADCREKPDHVYSEPGTYTITLMAEGEDGTTAMKEKTITVKE
ncbi:MAG: PKD domain-containing protein [Bacteroidales bacterium]|nr:PKD domain-containing protein [Bacteroidales bacterium]